MWFPAVYLSALSIAADTIGGVEIDFAIAGLIAIDIKIKARRVPAPLLVAPDGLFVGDGQCDIDPGRQRKGFPNVHQTRVEKLRTAIERAAAPDFPSG